MSALDEVIARLRAVDWRTSRPAHERSRVALMKEFLRRSALWSEALRCPERWPFFDIAATAPPGAPPAPPTDVAPPRLPTYVRSLIDAILRWAAAPPPTPQGLPDPYEPLLLLFERGGGFSLEGGMAFVDRVGIPIHDRGPYLRDAPFAALDLAAFDALDRGEAPPSEGAAVSRVPYDKAVEPGATGSCVPRGPGKSPVWFVGTPRGPCGLTLDEDHLLEVEQIELEDFYFSDAASWVERAAGFLRSTTHDALPVYVDHWYGRGGRYSRAAVVDGRLTSEPYRGPSCYAATRRVTGVEGRDYFRYHRLPGAGLPVFVAVRIVERLADLCRVAHRAGVVHGGIAAAAILVRPNGRPLLTRWSGSARRGRGSVGFDSERLWSIEEALGLDPQAASISDDVFRLGCLLSTLLTGRPPFDEEGRGVRYGPPSSRIAVPAAVDDAIGAVCDPARGSSASADSLQRALVSLLTEDLPPPERARESLREGDFVALAELVARHGEAAVPGFIEEARDAVDHFVVSALRRGHPAPLFSDFVLSVCADAREGVREVARDGKLSRWTRAAALSLLTQVDDAEVLPLAVEMSESGAPVFAAVGWGERPRLVREDGRACPHPWTSLVGEPLMDPPELRRICSLCGPVLLVDAWMAARDRATSEEAGGEAERELCLALDNPQEEDACVELKLGHPYFISSIPTATVFIEGLDPAHHVFLINVGRRELLCGLGMSGYSGFDLARTAVIDAALRPDVALPLRLGPVELVVAAPGRIEVRPDPGVRVRLNNAS